MNIYHKFIILLGVLFCILVSCSAVTGAVVIEPDKSGNGYSWSPDGLTVTITGASKEYVLSKTISQSITIHVDADEVTLNGNGVPITAIRGQPTLDLTNVHVTGAIFHELKAFGEFFGITECRNIKSSSITVVELIKGETVTYGLGHLYGNLDDTTIIVTADMAGGVETVYGEISSGTFTTTSPGPVGTSTYLFAIGVESVIGGKISGGTFTVTGNQASGVHNVHGEVSGGVFVITAEDDSAYGVFDLGGSHGYGEISGGMFTVTGKEAYGVGHIYQKDDLHDSGKISGGEFNITGKDEAYGIREGEHSSVIGGEFAVNGVRQQVQPTNAPQRERYELPPTNAKPTSVPQPWHILYLGRIGATATEKERQNHLAAFIEHNAGVKNACEIMYFYSPTCPSCQRISPWMTAFKNRYPEILFTSYNLQSGDSQAQLDAAKAQYGLHSVHVPIIFICGSVLEGAEPIEILFEPMARSVYNLPTGSS